VIGAKTLATLTLLGAELIAALALGLLSPERLATRGWGTLLLAGCFGVVVGTLMFRFWRLGEKSRHYFRWATESTPWELAEGHFLGTDKKRITLGENRGEAFDLPPRAQHVITVAIALVLALTCIDSRALGLLGRFRRTMMAATSSYCPDPEAPVTTVDPNVPGCELIRRAYALGYAKSLGDCELHKQTSTVEGSVICTRRQRDEPLFHYYWRLLDGFWTNFQQHSGPGYFHKARQDFDERVHRLASLRGAERQILASAPHASHHVWTNLPYPGDNAFAETSCADKYRQLPHRPTPPEGPQRASRVFEHVVAQLLFESSYEPAAGYCREFHVHWGAPLDACQQLAKNPEGFLASSSALDSVKVVLDRYRLGKELAALGAQKPPLEPQAFLSFQCYFEGGTEERKNTPFALAGYHFAADELRVPPSPPGALVFIDRYHAIAELLVHGFHYGRLLSEAGLEQGAATGLEASFAGRDYLLTRSYELDSIDIYLEPGWIAARPDLLEVYPYQRHLKNYVQTFRRQYRQERGRL
jgi:hypothetical protein